MLGFHRRRYTQFATAVMRRFYGVPCCAYFDDYCICEPTWCGRTGKNVEMSFSTAFLGVIADLARFHVDGTIIMRSKSERVARLVVAMTEALEAGVMPRPQRLSVSGKLTYTTSGPH